MKAIKVVNGCPKVVEEEGGQSAPSIFPFTSDEIRAAFGLPPLEPVADTPTVITSD
jgi:hypothetical protein